MADLESPAASSSGFSVADPAPLGLAAFALTTFLLSAKNADWTRGGDAWLSYALAYGGIGQLLAGMWEFRRGNTFGATAFSTYGAFWIGFYFYVEKAAGGSANISNDVGWILLAFAIVNLYLLISSLRVNTAVFLVFLALQITEIVLFLGFFHLAPNAFPTANHHEIIKIGGYLGVLTAALAFYASFAGVKASLGGRLQLPVGKPMDL